MQLEEKDWNFWKHKGYDIVADYSEMIEEPSYDDAKSITKDF